MKNYLIFALLCIVLMSVSNAQEIAIIDQGRNTTMTNHGSFYNPLCIGSGETWFAGNGFITGNQDIGKGNHVGIASVDLCRNSHFSIVKTGAFVPRTRSLPALNDFNAPYLRATMILNGIVPFYDFQAPFQNMTFGSNLRHGTHVANAAYEFDSNVKRKMIQVYRIDDKQANPQDCSLSPARTINPSSAVIGGVSKIIDALEEVAQNPDGVDAVNMSIAFRSSYCQRQQQKFIPDSCVFRDGQDEVTRLARLGIPFVVGLLNEDIDAREETWPACLDGVITVGSENDNSNVQNGGIGVGGDMFIDFYAKNTVSANGGAYGNSMAAPRIATAFALLKTAVPNSTIGERIEALNKASSLRNTYRVHGQNYTARHIKPNQIPNAIEELKKLVKGNVADIGFIDTNEYGSVFGDSSQNYSFEIDFNELIAIQEKKAERKNEFSSKTATVSPVRDVVLSFDAKMSSSSNGFDVFINGTKRESTTTFVNERSFEFTFKRTLFTSGKNTIRIAPKLDRPWGLTNIKAGFTPVVELTLNQVDRTQYGSEEDPERPTGLRASFELPDTENDVLFAVTGWDVTETDEVAVYLNGVEYGFLSKRVRFTDPYGPQDSFKFKKADLSEGQNVIEFVQKAGASKWGVTNMFVALDTVSPVLPLGIRNTQKYGNNYGTNEHPIRLDFSFSPISEHDHQVSWQGYDIDQSIIGGHSDIDVYLNDQLIKKIATTANNGLGAVETITMASRMFRAGVNTLSFRVNANARDTTWGITNLLIDISSIIDLDNEANLEKDYGYYTKYRGPVPFGWTRTYSTQDYQTRLYAQFNSTATQDKKIEVTGWDVDSVEELAVYVNGSFLLYVNSQEASSIYSEP